MTLPKWTEEGAAIRIFNGIELVAKKEFPDSPWMVKTVRCNMCGACCMGKEAGWMADTVGHDPETGHCGALIPKDDEPGKWVCRLGSSRPFMCCAYGGTTEECCIRWEEAK